MLRAKGGRGSGVPIRRDVAFAVLPAASQRDSDRGLPDSQAADGSPNLATHPGSARHHSPRGGVLQAVLSSHQKNSAIQFTLDA